MNRRWQLRSLLLACLLSTPVYSPAAASIDLHVVTQKLATIFVAERAPLLEQKLAATGLAPNEIQTIIAEAAVGHAQCVVDALAASDDPRSRELLAHMAEASTKQDVVLAWEKASPTRDLEFEERLGLVIRDCAWTVNQELGLPLDDDAT